MRNIMERQEFLKKEKKSEFKKLILIFLFFLSSPTLLFAQSFDGLNHLENYKTQTYYSNGAIEPATTMTERCDKVLAYYKNILNFEPSVSLLVLSPKDWS